MIVRPVLMTSVDHRTWNTVRKEHGIPEMSRGKDLNNPAFFINMSDERSLNLIHLGFLIIHDDYKDIAKLALESDCVIKLTNQYGSSDSEYLVSGSLRVLRDTCVSCSCKDISYNIRHMVNCIHQFMCKAGLKNLWDTYTKNTHKDGTYSLSLRR